MLVNVSVDRALPLSGEEASGEEENIFAKKKNKKKNGASDLDFSPRASNFGWDE